MTTLPDGHDLPDDVPTADYVDQHTIAEPDLEASDEEVSGGPVDAERVQAHELDADVEADEADLLDQATRVPPADDELDESV
jgi:hypothetical protein